MSSILLLGENIWTLVTELVKIAMFEEDCSLECVLLFLTLLLILSTFIPELDLNACNIPSIPSDLRGDLHGNLRIDLRGDLHGDLHGDLYVGQLLFLLC